jgi:nitroimidazol reductase NimA-like FMN-containing flavoprotein (pyridoxamine 5'-phosphate oxidase superfamily)
MVSEKRDEGGRDPLADRPDIPYGIAGLDEGIGLMPWHRLVERMRSAFVYWVATSSLDGRPHAIPVWGVWLEGALYFSNGATTRTGRNLAANTAVSVHLESGEDVAIIDGVAEAVSDAALIGRINDAYAPKYLWRERIDGPWYALRPETAFSWLAPSAGLGDVSVFAASATRWRFPVG